MSLILHLSTLCTVLIRIKTHLNHTQTQDIPLQMFAATLQIYKKYKFLEILCPQRLNNQFCELMMN